MPRAIRFHLDENVDPDVALGLRRRGIDVTTSQEAGLLSVTDAAQLAFAISESRLLVTHDDDLLKLHSKGVAHCGIAYCRPLKRSMGQIINGLVRMWEEYDPGEIANRVEYL